MVCTRIYMTSYRPVLTRWARGWAGAGVILSTRNFSPTLKANKSTKFMEYFLNICVLRFLGSFCTDLASFFHDFLSENKENVHGGLGRKNAFETGLTSRCMRTKFYYSPKNVLYGTLFRAMN